TPGTQKSKIADLQGKNGDGGIERCETTSRKRHGRADYAALSDMRCDRCAYANLTNGLVDLTPFRTAPQMATAAIWGDRAGRSASRSRSPTRRGWGSRGRREGSTRGRAPRWRSRGA